MTDLSHEENLIPGIYNYCDRWCERCEFTHRCRVFAMEQESPDNDGDLASTLARVGEVFAETKEMLLEEAERLGFDPFDFDHEEIAEIRRREKEFVDGDELSGLAERYWREAKPILDCAQLDTDDDKYAAALSVLGWYLFFIPVKVNSGLHGLLDIDGFEDKSQIVDSQSHANGTVKIGLVAIERSLAAWNEVNSSAAAPDVTPMIRLLEAIKAKLEARFPLAWDFIRPGFDELETVM